MKLPKNLIMGAIVFVACVAALIFHQKAISGKI
ncbi:hypothetical protein HNP86_001708 [Methanococcus maripaludis]|uniref:Uncharacterized protein n=1 Tax=Methanococcus maripaludis TaxID=39152 RepID=A0A7J9NWB9_METMI|nr:hypothetical protein [Methanococcus maripaludis]